MEMKETKEAILALVTLGKFVADRVKDGVQLDDALALGGALLTDGTFKDTVMAGFKDYDKIDDELKDLNFAKILTLAQILPDVIKVMTK